MAPRYDRPTAPVAFRLPEPTRRLLDYVAATTDTNVSDYMRALVETDLRARGFRLVAGTHAVLPRPTSRDELEQWEAGAWA